MAGSERRCGLAGLAWPREAWKQDVESALEQLLIAASISVVDIEQKSTVGAR